jgi:hypothetical protein
LKRYLCKDISKEFIVNQEGEALHSDCISHCLLYAFGECNHKHLDVCNNCNSFFELFDNIQNNVNADHQPIIDEYQKKLIYFMGHHARKTYLNAQLKANLAKLGPEEALFIVDYKMRILPKNARETKSEFYGKRGWTLHSVLVYSKDVEN